jgi:hypothetical protein
MALREDSPPEEVFYLPEHQAEREASNAMRTPINQAWVLMLAWTAGVVISVLVGERQFDGEPSGWYILLIIFVWFQIIFCTLEITCVWQHRAYLKKHWDRIDGGLEGRGLELLIASLKAPITHKNLFSRNEWSKGFIAWGVLDRDYATQNGYGYVAEVGNGIFSVYPAVFVLACMMFPLAPAKVLGVVSIAYCYQLIWGTACYMFGLWRLGDNSENSFWGNFWLIWGNFPWALVPMFGLYSSWRLIFDESYRIFFS